MIVQQTLVTQQLLIIKNCSDGSNFEMETARLCYCLLRRDIVKKLLEHYNRAYRQAKFISQNAVIQKISCNQPQPLNLVPFITKHNCQQPILQSILSCHCHLLMVNVSVKDHISSKPKLVFCRLKLIKGTLISSHHSGSSRRDKSDSCSPCYILNGGRDFEDHHFANCLRE